MIKAVRIVEFDAGHRVHNHESKCATLHGHRYKVEIFAEANELDSIGRIIDFSVLKEKIGGWIDKYWDHTTLVWKEDHATVDALFKIPRFKAPYITDYNPTAENMANDLLLNICPKLLIDTGVRVTKIKLWETPNCYVEAEL